MDLTYRGLDIEAVNTSQSSEISGLEQAYRVSFGSIQGVPSSRPLGSLIVQNMGTLVWGRRGSCPTAAGGCIHSGSCPTAAGGCIHSRQCDP